jgi:hypothetical protein
MLHHADNGIKGGEQSFAALRTEVCYADEDETAIRLSLTIDRFSMFCTPKTIIYGPIAPITFARVPLCQK